MTVDAIDFIDFLRENIVTLSLECQPLWHPLGFVSCIIKSDEADKVVRTHFWPPSERRTKNPDWPIHTHAYRLSSLVLAGKIEDIQYDQHEGDDFTIYEVTYDNGNSKITKSGKRTSISETVNLMQLSGCQYAVPRGVFHQSRVVYEMSAVTLVVMSDMISASPLVLGSDAGQSYPYVRSPFDKERFWEAIKSALDGFAQ